MTIGLIPIRNSQFAIRNSESEIPSGFQALHLLPNFGELVLRRGGRGRVIIESTVNSQRLTVGINLYSYCLMN
ncbi:MAG: hypothetical protein ACRAVC_11925 [Trichormus sp.]